MIWTYVFHTKALDPAYVAFLNRHSQFPPVVVRAVGRMQAGLPLEDLHALNQIRERLARPGKPPAPLAHAHAYDQLESVAARASALLHPTRSFPVFAALFFVRGLLNALPVYAPVYGVPLVLFRRRKLARDPRGVLTETLHGVARSSTFLALYCTLGIAFISLGRRLGLRHDAVGRAAMVLPALSGFVGGLATVIEKKPRRIELALYVLSKAVEGLHRLLKDAAGERFGSPPAGDTLAFAAALAVLMHANLRHPDVVRPVYANTLLRFFDTDVRHKMF